MKEYWVNMYDWDGFRYLIKYLSLEAAKADKCGHDMKLIYRIHVMLK